MQFTARALGWLIALVLALWVFVPSVIDIVTSKQFTAAVTPRPAIDPHLALTAHTGSEITQAELHGHPTAVLFGFTHCPDVCPTSLQAITDWLETLGPAGTDLQVWFITLDPARDDRQALAHYLENFSPRIIGLTGSLEAIQQAADSFGAYRRTVPVEAAGDSAAPARKDADYTIDHSASIYLFDRDGRFQDLIGFGEKPEFAVPKLRKLIGASTGPAAD